MLCIHLVVMQSSRISCVGGLDTLPNCTSSCNELVSCVRGRNKAPGSGWGLHYTEATSIVVSGIETEEPLGSK